MMYLVVGGAGLILLLINLLMGEVFEHFDHDGDFGSHDVDHGAEHEPLKLISFRMICIYCVGIGVGGGVAHLAGVTEPFKALAALASLVVFGFIGVNVMSYFTKSLASSTLTDANYVGAVGVLIQPIIKEGTGEMDVIVAGQSQHLIVRTQDGSSLPQGTQVKIVTSVGGTTFVEKLQ